MEQDILVPDIGDYSNVEVIDVVIKPGDKLAKDATMITLETDKATMDIPAPGAMEVQQVLVKVGDRVSKGSLIAIAKLVHGILDATELGRQSHAHRKNLDNKFAQVPIKNLVNSDDIVISQELLGEKTVKTDQVVPAVVPSKIESLATFVPDVVEKANAISEQALAYASPSVRKFARELGVNLDEVVGTGKYGRIVIEDVKNYVKTILQARTNSAPGAVGVVATSVGAAVATSSTVAASSAAESSIDFSKWGTVTTKALSRIKRKSGQNLHKNWLAIPHVTHFDQADITDLEQFRKSQQQLPQAKAIKLTPLVFLIKAVIFGLKQHPDFNSSLSADGDSLIIKNYYNIGVAVDTPFGLVVPVIKDADRKDMFALAADLARLSQLARDNKLTSSDMQGGCFTISSLGGISGTGFTPIINAPEVAILGVSKHKITPTYVGEELQPRLMLPIALSYDHRVIDGAAAARFCKIIVEQLAEVKNFYE